MDSPVAPGDILLGKYRVERVLGQGGMGVVVAARHVELGQLYAIKFLLPSILSRGEALERFLREARAAARLGSEHVAKVHDVGRMESGAPYMLMEYLDGSDLKAILAQRGALPVDEAVTYVLQTCDAIAEAHEAGIVHRDLKPANLFLVRRRNGSPCVKVIDFGISKQIGAERVDLTQTNAQFGSPLYMSPEQMARTKSVDSRTDIWAIGVILYELLAGVSPFKALTMTEVVSLVLQEEPAPLQGRRYDVPPSLEAVILRCLRKRREERFQTVEELIASLSPFGMPLPSIRPPMGTDVRLGPVIVQATTEAPFPQVSTASIPAGSSTTDAAPSTDPTTVAWGNTGASRSAKDRMRWLGIVAAVAGLAGAGSLAWLALRGSSQEAAPLSISPAAAHSTPIEEKSAMAVLPSAPLPPISETSPEERAPASPLEKAGESAPKPTGAPQIAAPVPTAKTTSSVTQPQGAPSAAAPAPSTPGGNKKRRGVL